MTRTYKFPRNPSAEPQEIFCLANTEIVVPYPNPPLTSVALDADVIKLLEKHYTLVNILLQPLCHEGGAFCSHVENDGDSEDGGLKALAVEAVYRGCEDLNYEVEMEVPLVKVYAPDGVHIYVPDGIVLDSQRDYERGLDNENPVPPFSYDLTGSDQA